MRNLNLPLETATFAVSGNPVDIGVWFILYRRAVTICVTNNAKIQSWKSADLELGASGKNVARPGRYIMGEQRKDEEREDS